MNISYRRFGNGKRIVVMLHEWMSDSRTWDPILPYLDCRAATYILVDLRGYGLSRNLAGAFDLAEASADILNLLTELGHFRFYVACHSMSGLIAEWLAQIAPSRVRGLFGVSPIPPQGFLMDDAALSELLKVIEDDDVAIEAIAARTGNRYGHGWLSARLASMKEGASKHAMVGYARMIARTEISAGARGSKIPFLVICGDHDIAPLRPEPMNDAFTSLHRQATIIKLNEAGHFAMLEQPVYVASALEEFVLRGPEE